MSPRTASADNCNPYGPYGAPCPSPEAIAIDKKVRNPISGVFVDNLGSDDAAYSPGSEVIFQLVITNTSAVDFGTVEVKDILPERLKDGSVVDDNKDDVFEENFNSNARELTFKIKDLKAGEGREVKVKATVVSSGFETTKDTFCGLDDKLQNKAEAKKDNLIDSDTADVCVKTQVLGVTTLPQAGVADVLPLLPFIGLGATGIALFLKRK